MTTALPRSKIIHEVENFLVYLEKEKNASPLTIRNYNHYLRRFDSWLKVAKLAQKVEELNEAIVLKYAVQLSKLANGKGGQLSKKTQSYHLIAIRSFLRWLIKNNFSVMQPDGIAIPKGEEREIKYLSGKDIDVLLAAPKQSSLQGKRDKAILEVFFSTGLRVSELVRLNRDEFNLEKGEFEIVGKGGKKRDVFLSSRAIERVKDYLVVRKDKYNPLFIRHKGKMDVHMGDEKMRLTPRSVQRMIKKYAQEAKIQVEVTPQILRNSFATDLLMAGADLRSVQEMLGHKNVSTTQIYTHVTNKQLRDIHAAFHGKGGN